MFSYSFGSFFSLIVLYQSKLVVLKSISNFLRVALSPATFRSSEESFIPISSKSTWCLSSAFPEPSAYKTLDALFRPATNLETGSRPATRLWKAEVDSEDAEDFVCNPMPFESVAASYTLRDLHDTISATSRNDHPDSRFGDREPNFEMVCHTCYYVYRIHGVVLAFSNGTAPGPLV